MESENSRVDRRGNQSFERLLIVAEAHHPTPCMLLITSAGVPQFGSGASGPRCKTRRSNGKRLCFSPVFTEV